MSNIIKNQVKNVHKRQQDQKKVNQKQPGITAKQDVRRKILIGSYFLHKAKTEDTLSELYQAVKSYLTRDGDLQLFEKEKWNDFTLHSNEL